VSLSGTFSGDGAGLTNIPRRRRGAAARHGAHSGGAFTMGNSIGDPTSLTQTRQT